MVSYAVLYWKETIQAIATRSNAQMQKTVIAIEATALPSLIKRLFKRACLPPIMALILLIIILIWIILKTPLTLPPPSPISPLSTGGNKNISIQSPRSGAPPGPRGQIRVDGTHNLPVDTTAWIVLRDKYGHYFLQNPPIRFEQGGTWSQGNVIVGADIAQILVMQVTPQGHQQFQDRVKRSGWEPFDQLPDGTIEVAAMTLESSPPLVKVLSPHNDDMLDYGGLIRGYITKGYVPFILVQPMNDSLFWVQPRIETVNADGTFTGQAWPGTVSEGCNKFYKIMIIGHSNPKQFQANEPPRYEPLQRLPQDVITSDAVVVKRSLTGCNSAN